MSEVYLYRFIEFRTKKVVVVNRLFESSRQMRRAYPNTCNGFSDLCFFDGNGEPVRVSLSCSRLLGEYYYGMDLDFANFVQSSLANIRPSRLPCFRFAVQ